MPRPIRTCIRPRRAASRPPYEEWSKDDLYGRAQELDIEGRSEMSKSELIEALRR